MNACQTLGPTALETEATDMPLAISDIAPPRSNYRNPEVPVNFSKARCISGLGKNPRQRYFEVGAHGLHKLGSHLPLWIFQILFKKK